MPSIFAVANPKGGSGKTTVAIILAGEFAKHGYSVAIVDADPQGSSYQWHASSVARGLSPQGVDLVRAADEAALGQAVERLHGYDVVVIDTPGYYGEVLIQSALQADLVGVENTTSARNSGAGSRRSVYKMYAMSYVFVLELLGFELDDARRALKKSGVSYDDLATALVKRNEADRRVARQTRSRKLPG